MGLTINMGNKNSPPEDGLIKALLKPADMTVFNTVRDVLKPEFKLGFYDVEMHVKSNQYLATMPVTVSNILKGGASPEQRSLCRNKLMSMFKAALLDANIGVPELPVEEDAATSAYKAQQLKESIYSNKIPGMPKIGEIEAAVAKSNKGKSGKTLAQLVDDMVEVAKGIDPTKPGAQEKLAAALTGNQLPTGTPVALKHAKVLGQPVRGTNATSVYYTVALSERVRLAIRVHNNIVSVRAEGDFIGMDVKKMQAFGMSAGDGGHYYSMHVACEGVPIPRVVGAILMGLGIDFDQQVTNFKNIKVTS